MPTTDLTRRSFLTRMGTGLAGLVATSALLEACGSSSSSHSSSVATPAKSTSLGSVTGIVWKGYDNPAAFKTLTTKGGLTAQWEYISASNNEIITKLRGGAELIDVVTPGAVFIPVMVEGGCSSRSISSQIPNVKQLYPAFQNPTWAQVDGKAYGVPITFYNFPINSRPSIIPETIATYSQLENPKYKGKLATTNDPQNMYLMLKEVLGTSDFSKLTKAQLAQGVDLFSKIKPNLVTIAASFGDVIDLMSRGDAGLCILGYGLVQSTLLARHQVHELRADEGRRPDRRRPVLHRRQGAEQGGRLRGAERVPGAVRELADELVPVHRRHQPRRRPLPAEGAGATVPVQRRKRLPRDQSDMEVAAADRLRQQPRFADRRHQRLDDDSPREPRGQARHPVRTGAHRT